MLNLEYNMVTLSTEQAVLMRRMNWSFHRERPYTSEDERLVPLAIRMLSYIACLNYAVCELEEELKEAGKYRHEVKRRFQQVQRVAQSVHETAYQMLHGNDPDAARQYNDATDGSWQELSDAVLLSAPERAFNIVVALCRLIERLNTKLGGKYDFAPAKQLYAIPSLLRCCGLEDHHIDLLVDRVVS